MSAGDYWVRRQSAARSGFSNTASATLTWDQAELDVGGWSYSSGELTLPETAPYLLIYDIGLAEQASTIGHGTLSPRVNGTTLGRYSGTTRYTAANVDGASFAAFMAMFDADAEVSVRVGSVVPESGTFDSPVDMGGGFQALQLPNINRLRVSYTLGAASVVRTGSVGSRPIVESDLTWTTCVFDDYADDTDNFYDPDAGTGDITLKSRRRYLIHAGGRMRSAFTDRQNDLMRLTIDGATKQVVTGYYFDTDFNDPEMQCLYLHKTGETDEVLNLDFAIEQDADTTDAVMHRAYVEVIELPESAEWIHADNGSVDWHSGTLLSSLTAWYDMPLGAVQKQHAKGALVSTAEGVKNVSGETMPVLVIGWQFWDRDATSSSVYKDIVSQFEVDDSSALGYGMAGSLQRGNPGSDAAYLSGFVGAAIVELADGSYIKQRVRAQHQSSGNQDAGVFVSENRNFLGMQVLDLRTLDGTHAPSVNRKPILVGA